MALTIKETPILKGKAAKEFLNNMLCSEKIKKIPSKKVSKAVEEDIRNNESKS